MKQNEKKEQLTVNIQYIKDLSFENQNSPDSLSTKVKHQQLMLMLTFLQSH